MRECDAALLMAAPLPPALLEELREALVHGPVWSARTEGRPVAFAFAPWRTTHWYAISVDTLPAYRRQGHATRAFAALWRHGRAEGLAPVWGAEKRNVASMQMAARLGFLRAGEVFVFTRIG